MIPKKIIEFLRKGYIRYKPHKQNKPEISYRLSCNDNSLSVYKQDIFGNHDESSINWKEMNFIFVYKEDLLTVDRICMYLGKSPSEGFVVHEDMEGWDELEKHLPQYLPGALNMEAWWEKVYFPAFATNLTLVYKDPAYPNSEIQKILEGQQKQKPKPSKCLLDVGLYISSFLPWALCFFSRIASYQHGDFLSLKVLFWLGIILILPSIILLVKVVIRFMSWGDLFKNPKTADNVSGILFVISIFIYTVAVAVSLSVL